MHGISTRAWIVQDIKKVNKHSEVPLKHELFLPHFLGFFKLLYPLKYTLYDLMRKIISILFLAFPI